MHAIIIVLVLPPRESFSNLVSLESQYGTKVPVLFLSLRMLMQLPNANRLRLMLAPSTILWPVLLEMAALSLPARSMSEILDDITSLTTPSCMVVVSTLIYKMA